MLNACVTEDPSFASLWEQAKVTCSNGLLRLELGVPLGRCFTVTMLQLRTNTLQ